MRFMVSGQTTVVEKLLKDERVAPYLGAMVTPTTGNSLARVCSWRVPYCLDNSAFAGNKKGFSAPAYMSLVTKAADAPTAPVFVTVPDVVHLTADGPVGDHKATLKLFYQWVDRLLPFGLPLAFVAQDGIGLNEIEDDIPWPLISAVFIGGSDWFKDELTMYIAEACRERSKWCHLGRVNGKRRLRLAHGCGCDSVDGSSLSKHGMTWLPKFAQDVRDIWFEEELSDLNCRLMGDEIAMWDRINAARTVPALAG